MPRFSPKVLTANALASGEVIYRTRAGDWSPLHADAELLEDEALANERLVAAGTDNQLVGAYLADAKAGPQGPEPTHIREAFRTRGPSNYNHGKQEGSNA